ncbi:hypothetical protein C8R31_101668 [Nitrosospira sp. Nsp2]|uniref:hypothetical protein n=1 Tax=Nitrosospira sp. Nsp2 TaxID=136548 RepID=UPI000D30F4F4|nr:hypothetical protein [Nitrosospira sp. Nsp2]PTR17504.1 hypothetical protein C8R31_101668 [Nitrosospira sp. Nsp2]
MFDISKLAVNETTDIHLRGADDEPLVAENGKPMTITVNGPGTKAFAKAQSARNKATIERFQRKGKNKADTTLEETAEFLAAVTVSFNNFQYLELEGYEQFKACYLDTKIGFIAEQVNKELGDWSNFTKGSTKS